MTAKASWKGPAEVVQSLRGIGGSIAPGPNVPYGTTVVLRAPVAFQFVEGVAFDVQGHSIVLEMEHIREVIQPAAGDLSVRDGAGMLALRDAMAPFLDAASIFQGDEAVSSRKSNDIPRVAVIVGNGHGNIALGVDDLRGRFRGPVLPLPSIWGRASCLAGCVLLADGHVGLMPSLEVISLTY